jgi:hypothetical protein
MTVEGQTHVQSGLTGKEGPMPDPASRLISMMGRVCLGTRSRE